MFARVATARPASIEDVLCCVSFSLTTALNGHCSQESLGASVRLESICQLSTNLIHLE